MIGPSLAALFGRTGSGIATERLKLSRSVVKHDSIDKMEHGNFVDESAKFQRIALEEAPVVVPDAPEPPAIDMTTATPEEFAQYQAEARAAKKSRDEAPPYKAWGELTRDVFYTYHSHDTPEVVSNAVDPSVELHKRILPKLMAEDDHAQSRNITRNDPTMSALATLAAVGKLKDVLGTELAQQMREAEEFQQQRENAQQSLQGLQDLRQQAQELHQQGQPIPQQLREEIKQAVQQKVGAQEAAAQIAQSPTPMNAAGAQAIAQAAAYGQEAAENAANLPSFGGGLGAGEPTYTSPEEALSVAEQWANNPDLKHMAELFGRLDRHISFHRAKRVVGGNDEIVDVRFGNNLARVLPSELALLADDDLLDDFLVRYTSGELLEFSTVGEENAGRGPIVMVCDGSGSMAGLRTIWARAVAMCLLHICRKEKRDFVMIEFAGGTQCAEWMFRTGEPLMAAKIVEMASHFFSGGTAPITGMTRAAEIMKSSAPFKKADIIVVGDGEASFGDEDRRLKEQMLGLGVRLFGIGVGGSFSYLGEYCEYVVNVHDFDLNDPSTATAELAVHIT